MKRLLPLFYVAGVCAIASACGNSEFDPQGKVDSVRILTSKADKSLAKPGDTVNLDLLVVDGRPNKAVPVRTAWIPLPCLNPPEDLYYLCFAQALGGGRGDAGADAGMGMGMGMGMGAAALLQPGADITDVLPQGSKFSFRVPDNALQARPRAKEPYGLMIYFNIACAGRIRVDAIDPAKGPQQIPFYCSDAAGKRLPPSEYVVGFTRVYVYANRSNANPEATGLTWQGQPVDLKKGIEVERCTTQGTRKNECPEVKLGVQVPDAAQELNEGEVDLEGRTSKEIVWATFYSTAATFEGDARLLFDARTGRVADPNIRVYPAETPQSGSLWVVTKDNRGGTSWLDVPFLVK
jgi:hypothetical protein